MQTYIKKWLHAKTFSKVQYNELASMLKTSASLFEKIVDGERAPSVAQLDKLSEILGVSIDDLIHTDPDTITEESTTTEEPTYSYDPGKEVALPSHIREWMNVMGVSYSDIMAKTGIPKNIIDEWADGKSSPTVIQAIALADILHTDVTSLFTSIPSESIGSQTSTHVFETDNVNSILRFQRYLELQGMDYDTLGVISSDSSYTLLIRYRADRPVNPMKIPTILLNPKYKDSKEKIKNVSKRMEGIPIYDLRKDK